MLSGDFKERAIKKKKSKCRIKQTGLFFTRIFAKQTLCHSMDVKEQKYDMLCQKNTLMNYIVICITMLFLVKICTHDRFKKYKILNKKQSLRFGMETT